MERSHIRPRRTRLGRGGSIKNIMHYVYILFSQKLNKKHIGGTSNLKTRIQEHNSGKSKFSSKGIPWNLIYYEAFLNKKDALKEEAFLKTGKGRERIKYLFGRVA